MSDAFVICVDGPSGAGKGSITQLLASKLGFNLLDSGALYRVVAIAALKAGVALDDESALAKLAQSIEVDFEAGELGEPARVKLNGVDISTEVRAEETGKMASKVAPLREVRAALFDCQRAFAKAPGLVADGRDMGTVIFPAAQLKVYLTASAEERAKRRYLQLKNKGESVSLAAVLQDIQKRDDRDMNREEAPLKPADDAIIVDSSTLTVDDVLSEIIALYSNK